MEMKAREQRETPQNNRRQDSNCRKINICKREKDRERGEKE